MIESEYKRKIVRQIRLEDGWGRRVEDQYAVGYPDLNLIPLGGPVFFAEVKIIKPGWGATERQLLELNRITAAGGRHVVALLIGVDEKERLYVATGPSSKVRANDLSVAVPIDKHKDWTKPITELLKSYHALVTQNARAGK